MKSSAAFALWPPWSNLVWPPWHSLGTQLAAAVLTGTALGVAIAWLPTWLALVVDRLTAGDGFVAYCGYHWWIGQL